MTSAILLHLGKIKETQQLNIIRNLSMKCQLLVSIGITNLFSSNEISGIKIYLLASISVWQTPMHILAEFL